MAHIKRGWDSAGRYVIIYGGHKRITWLRGDDAAPFFPKATVPGPAGAAAHLNSVLGAAAGFAGPLGRCIDSVVAAVDWWDKRQAAQRAETHRVVAERTGLLADMIGQWVTCHRDIEGLDLELSHYLGREALYLLQEAKEGEGGIVPQALLYDLEQIRRAIVGGRDLLVEQFGWLTRHGGDLAAPSGDGSNLTINAEWLALVATDPELSWRQAVQTKEVGAFADELRFLSDNPDQALLRLFSLEEDSESDSWFDAAILGGILGGGGAGAAVGVAAAQRLAAAGIYRALAIGGGPLGMAGAAAIPIAIDIARKRKKNAETRRADTVRELALFCATVEQTRLLHRSWLAVSDVIALNRGFPPVTRIEGSELSLVAPRADGALALLDTRQLRTRLQEPASTILQLAGPAPRKRKPR